MNTGRESLVPPIHGTASPNNLDRFPQYGFGRNLYQLVITGFYSSDMLGGGSA